TVGQRLCSLLPLRPPAAPRSTLFPYTTLFRSLRREGRITVIPVLVGHDEMPPKTSLPSDLKQLADIDAVILSERHWEIDVQELRSEEHTSELQSPDHLVCRLLLEKKKNNTHEQ